MHYTNTPAYRKAFIQYLRRGIPLILLHKEEDHPQEPKEPTHYVWRTAGDDKVRPSHAANDGHVFAWDDPPDTGHPGEEEGCRCWAEPVTLPNDPPIEPVYPELGLLPLLGIGGRAAALAANAIQRVRSSGRVEQSENATEHGAIRTAQRRISSNEIDDAIRSATNTGRVSTVTGKYGTPQIHYTGSNGITVVVETSGRNAGKIITLWRN